MTEYEAEEFLRRKGFQIVKRNVFKNSEEAMRYAKEVGFPVVLKIVSDSIIHKSDIHGVIQNVEETNFKSLFDKLMKIKKVTSIMVQKYIPGEYLLLGLKKDPVFGYSIAVGSGGIYTEIMHDISFRILPITREDCLNMLKELKIYPILSGARGQKFNIPAIVNTMLKLSRLTKENIKELDINPLIVNSKNASIIDAKIIFY